MQDDFAEYKKVIDYDIAIFVKRSRALVEQNYGAVAAEIADSLFELLSRGGKRIRGALAMKSYAMFGGQDELIAQKIALICELLQAHLLIFDDIMDQSLTRRGGPTVHKLIEKWSTNLGFGGGLNEAHFGEAQAMNVGLVAANLAQSVIFELSISPEQKIAMTDAINTALTRTNFGQIRDNAAELVDEIDTAEITQTLRLKTANYTFWLPLELSAIAAGADTSDAEFVAEFCDNLGVAFQIQDDIIGTFGDDEKTGKSSRDDLAEGKRTLLVAYALAHGTMDEKRALRAVLGNHDMTDAEFEKARNAIESSGARRHAEKQVENYATWARQVVKQAPAAVDKTFMNALITFATKRSL
jgi:geranylgeranyl diphosphate synthase type I